MRALPFATAAAALLACAGAAAERQGTPPPDPPTAAAGAPLPAWAPRVPQREEQDRREIEALLQALVRADEGGEVEAVAALIEFPLLTVSDDQHGQAVSVTWTRERWVAAMRPISGPMPGVQVEHRPAIFLVSDAIAVATDEQTITRRGRALPGRVALVLVRTAAGWRVKTMIEAGWGEMMRRLERDAGGGARREPRPVKRAGAPRSGGGTQSLSAGQPRGAAERRARRRVPRSRGGAPDGSAGGAGRHAPWR